MTNSGKVPSWLQALEIILDAASVKEVETLDMTSAVGRVLATPMVAADDFPPFDRSSVDGYAIRSADTVTPPAVLQIIGSITAGAVSSLEIQLGQCMKVMAGAPLPSGADAVIPMELVIGKGTDIEVDETTEAGSFYIAQGAEYQKGQEVIPAGTLIGATEIGLMAQMGMQQIHVHKAPTVALIVTGDELVEPWVKPQPSVIRNSNAYTMLTLMRQIGVAPHYLGICPDKLPAMSEKILSGMQDDLVIIVGGTAKGDKDFVRESLDNLGAEILVDGIALKPGGTSVFARRKSCLLMSLPGPPGAMRTAFHLLVQPLLLRMMGHMDPVPVLYSGTFKGSFTKPEEVEFFLGARAEFHDDGYVLEPSHAKAFASWQSWTTSNALIRIPYDMKEINDGERVSFIFTSFFQ